MNGTTEWIRQFPRPNKKAVIVIFILFTTAMLVTGYWDWIKPQAEALLRSKNTRILAAVYCFVAVTVKFIFFEKDKNAIYRIIEFLLTATGYSTAAVSSINLIGAAYSDFFGTGDTFKSLAILDTTSIIVSSSILLIYCAIVCTKMLRDALFLSAAESIKPAGPTQTNP
jgi:hypothetical protein